MVKRIRSETQDSLVWLVTKGQQVMKKARRSAMRFVSMSLAIAGLMQADLPAGYAQSTGAANQNTYFIVNIPQSDVFFVAGEVVRPGSFPLTEGATLLQAIVRAGGATSRAKPGNALVFRQDPNNGKRQEISVDLDAITSGKQKDIPLLPNDIVVVPNSRAGNTPWPRFLDAPPSRVFAPCRGSRLCLARLDSSLFEPANKRD